MPATSYCPGGGQVLQWDDIPPNGMVRCSVCNRRLHFHQPPDECRDPQVPRHKPRVKKRKQPSRKTKRGRR